MTRPKWCIVQRKTNAGCFSFGDANYEASTALANAEVEIAYDPMNTETIKVLYQDMKPIIAHRVSIGAFCEKTLIYAYQQWKRLIDEHMVRFVADHEMVGGIE